MDSPSKQRIFKKWQSLCEKNEYHQAKVKAVLPQEMANVVAYVTYEIGVLKVFLTDASFYMAFMAHRKQMIQAVDKTMKINCKITVIGCDVVFAKKMQTNQAKAMPKAAKKAFTRLGKTLNTSKLKSVIEAMGCDIDSIS